MKKISNFLKKIGLDNFILSLFAIVALAYFQPYWGTDASPLPLGFISNVGVSLIFFFYGLKLSPEKLKSGLRNIPLHFLIQGSTFVLFPFIVWMGKLLIQPSADDQIWVGIYFLAALPSTVSSSVVMVSMARGNIPAAIFNASISSLIGVFMTPIIMGLFLNATNAQLDLLQVIFDLILQVIVPVGAGILLYPYLGKIVSKFNNGLKIFDQTIIIIIVYQSFCVAFDQGLYQQISTLKLIEISVIMLALFGFLFFLISKICQLLNFSIEDRITAAFCGSKKSLVHGTVMSNVIFKGNPNAGIILLPLMIYHTLQLIAASVIAQKLGSRSDSQSVMPIEPLP
ncbi:MAG TPA: bile acid:sodium symporter family protein [Chitinophagales bacterium]|nr:bile acid:sodium symporter family protein [Chitinophagales bacterium]